ncbi:MAG: hypothetical protein V4481_03585 [Patescibacteria group bacterium]
MPLVIIQRDPEYVNDFLVLRLRSILHVVVSAVLSVKPDEVEIWVREPGPLDLNYPPVGIMIDTGTGSKNWRVEQKLKLAIQIAEALAKKEVLPVEWLGPKKSYVWMRICESAFVPIGYPESAR